MTAEELEERMSERELRERMALESICPTDDWWQAAAICASLFNSNPWRGQDAKPVRAGWFIPGYVPEEPEDQDAGEVFEVFSLMAAM